MVCACGSLASLSKALSQCPHPLPHLHHLSLPAPTNDRHTSGLRSLVSCCRADGPLPGVCVLRLSDEDYYDNDESDDEEWRHANTTAQATECCRRRTARAHRQQGLRRELGLGAGHRVRLAYCSSPYTGTEARGHSAAPDHAYCP